MTYKKGEFGYTSVTMKKKKFVGRKGEKKKFVEKILSQTTTRNHSITKVL